MTSTIRAVKVDRDARVQLHQQVAKEIPRANEDMHRTEVDRESARPSRRLLVGAAALALLSIGTFVVYQSRDDGVTGQPPVEVATSFIEAYGAFDAERAITYLADDPDISQMI